METEIRNLYCDLTPEQVEDYRKRIPEMVQAQRELVDEVKRITADAKARQKEGERKIFELSDAARSGREKRDVRCVWIPRGHQAELIREDTGKVIDVKLLREPTWAESKKQTTLFDEDSDSKASAGKAPEAASEATASPPDGDGKAEPQPGDITPEGDVLVAGPQQIREAIALAQGGGLPGPDEDAGPLPTVEDEVRRLLLKHGPQASPARVAELLGWDGTDEKTWKMALDVLQAVATKRDDLWCLPDQEPMAKVSGDVLPPAFQDAPARPEAPAPTAGTGKRKRRGKNKGQR